MAWFDSVEQSHPLDGVAGYVGPVQAVTGAADDVVPPEVSDVFVQTVASTDITRYTVDGADHESTRPPATSYTPRKSSR